MEAIIKDIREKIHNNYYLNEEHIRLNLVIRILEKLGWEIWNPKEVNAEFLVAPNEDKTKVDLALFHNNYSPCVFIEIKYLGKIVDKLSHIERQLRNYNRDNTATFSIITDGRIWRFYYSQIGGEFSQKCFKQIDLLDDDFEDIDLHFNSFLSKSEIQSGNAEQEANKYLTLNQKQKAMEDALPQARRLIQEPPYPSLPECLLNIVRESGVILDIDEAIEYIKATPVKRIDTIEPLHITGKKLEKSESFQNYVSTKDMRWTKILEGRVEQNKSTGWSELVRYALKYAIDTGMTLDELNFTTNLNLKRGSSFEKGFIPIPGGKISMQQVSATKATINLKTLAQKLKFYLYIEFEWEGKSPNAGKKGLIEMNAR